jgi:hypothetical protein
MFSDIGAEHENRTVGRGSTYDRKGLIEGADIVRFIKAQRIKRLGHIQRMDQARPTGKLFDWKPMGTRPLGRQRQRWQEDVMEDLKELKVKNWKEAAKGGFTHSKPFPCHAVPLPCRAAKGLECVLPI